MHHSFKSLVIMNVILFMLQIDSANEQEASNTKHAISYQACFTGRAITHSLTHSPSPCHLVSVYNRAQVPRVQKVGDVICM